MSPKVKSLIKTLNEAAGTIEALRDEKQEDFDEMSESVQEGERGEEITKTINALDEAAVEVYQAVETLKEFG
jgi:hypothetical protein